MAIIKNLLKEHGYSLVALPKADISPLQLLSKETGYVSFLGGTVQTLFTADEAGVPHVERDAEVNSIQGETSLSFDLEGGISFLENIFKVIGINHTYKLGSLKGSTNLKNADSVVFSFSNPKEDRIDLLGLDKFLNGSIPQEKAFKSYVKRLKESDLYVISAVLKSTDFSIEVFDSNATYVDISADVKSIVDVDGKVSRDRDSEYKIQYKGDKPFVFALKAVQVLYDKPKWFEFWNKEEAYFRIKNQESLVVRGDESEIYYLEIDNFILSGEE